MPLAGGIIAGGGALLSGVLGLFGSKSAADKQAEAAKYAADLQNSQYQQTRTDQMPWLQAGQFSLSQLTSGLQPGGYFSTPINPTEADAAATPGYQFTQDEGLKGINAAAAGAGGAFTTGDLRKAARYTTGLADQTYNDVFNRQMTNQTNIYNKLASLSGLGQTSANQLGVTGTQSAADIGSLLTSAAASRAAGIVGGTNAITGGIAGATNSLTGYMNLQQLLNQQKLLNTNNQAPPAQGYIPPTQPYITQPTPNSGDYYGEGA